MRNDTHAQSRGPSRCLSADGSGRGTRPRHQGQEQLSRTSRFRTGPESGGLRITGRTSCSATALPLVSVFAPPLVSFRSVSGRSESTSRQTAALDRATRIARVAARRRYRHRSVVRVAGSELCCTRTPPRLTVAEWILRGAPRPRWSDPTGRCSPRDSASSRIGGARQARPGDARRASPTGRGALPRHRRNPRAVAAPPGSPGRRLVRTEA